LVQTPNDLESIPVDAVIDKIRQNAGWVDGVVVTGGEPTSHKHLDEFLTLLKNTGVVVRLDTNGTNPRIVEDFIARKLLDCVAMDVKAPLRQEKYEMVSGVPCNIKDIRESIRIIMESGIEYEFRTTVCPSQLDGDDIEEIARTIQGAGRYVLQAFRPNHCLDAGMLKIEPYSAEILRGFAARAGAYVGSCCVRGEEGKVLQRNW
jgi:Pyruvate-formate lyase-activating enzyme